MGLVLAPAGCGKTTLLAEWARRFAGSVAWYRAQPDDLPQRLVDHLAVAVGLPPCEPSLGVDDVARALDDAKQPRLLVVDDVHTLPEKTSRSVLESLLMDLPPATTVLLGSRRAPDLDVTHGEIATIPVMIGAEDLRFRSWEVESLFRDVYGAPLLPEDAASLARHTEGWAAALHLFHLSTAQSSAQARRRAIEALARRNRYARGYLSRQVLHDLGPDLSGFMRRTAVFETLTAARCDALLQTTGSQALLEELTGRQTLTSSDDGGMTFRYHEVLRRHLEADLEAELGPAGLRDWYGRAARLLEADGAVVEALRVRARAQDWAGVRALLVTSGDRIATRAGGWPGLVPTGLLRNDPWVAVAEAYRLLGDGRIEEAESTARRAVDGLDDVRGHDRVRELLTVTRAWRTLEATPAGRWYERVAAGLGDLPRGSAHPRSSGASVAETLAWPFLVLLRGDLGAAQAALPAAREVAEPEGPAALALGLLDSALAALGGQSNARAIAEGVAIQAELADLDWFARAARALLAASDPDTREGESDLGRLVALCERRGDPWGAAWAEGIGALVGARACWSSDRLEADAAHLLRRFKTASERFALLGASVPAVWLSAVASVLLARTGAAGAADAARSAQEQARRVGCMGAEACASGARGLAAGDRSLLRAADLLADEVGLLLRPWAGDGVVQHASQRPGVVLPSPTSRSLRFVLFGGFRLEHPDRRAVDLTGVRPQHRLLLRLLALHADAFVHREELTQALWPGHGTRAAGHRLQTAVSALRGLLDDLAPSDGASIVARDGPRYGLRLGPSCSVDVHDFRVAIDRARSARRAGDRGAHLAALQHAVECYVDDLLPEDGPAEWVVEPREDLRLQAAGAACTLAVELAVANPRAAVTVADDALRIDPYNDEAWRLLISLHTDLGDVALAQRARASYEWRLRQLGVAPPSVSPG